MSDQTPSTFKRDCFFLTSGLLIGFCLKKAYSKLFAKKSVDYNTIKRAYQNIQPSTKPNTPQIDTKSTNYKETVTEQLTRNCQYFGPKGLQKIQNANIIVVGVGGVGSHVAAQLIRAGVGRVKVIDFDLVTLSSLNRHAFAVRRDVGISKVECIRNYARDIFPHVQIDVENKLFAKKNADELISFGTNDQGEDVKIGNPCNPRLRN